MALVASNGDANQAVERLLGNCFFPFRICDIFIFVTSIITGNIGYIFRIIS